MHSARYCASCVVSVQAQAYIWGFLYSRGFALGLVFLKGPFVSKLTCACKQDSTHDNGFLGRVQSSCTLHESSHGQGLFMLEIAQQCQVVKSQAIASGR